MARMAGIDEDLLPHRMEGAVEALLLGGVRFNSRRNPMARLLLLQLDSEIPESRPILIDPPAIPGWNGQLLRAIIAVLLMSSRRRFDSPEPGQITPRGRLARSSSPEHTVRAAGRAQRRSPLRRGSAYTSSSSPPPPRRVMTATRALEAFTLYV